MKNKLLEEKQQKIIAKNRCVLYVCVHIKIFLAGKNSNTLIVFTGSQAYTF